MGPLLDAPFDMSAPINTAVTKPYPVDETRPRDVPYAVPVLDRTRNSNLILETIYRGFEIGAAFIGLVFGLPFILLGAVLIRLETPGLPMFLHRRPARSAIALGRDLERRTDVKPPPGGYEGDKYYHVPAYFILPKLRTMYADAQTRFPELYSYPFTVENFHDQFPTLRHDPRVTRVGGILRKLSIDELPNLWSVLVGDIRLVGPRPEAPQVLQYYTPEEMYKFTCQPGITGLAQTSGRGLLNWGQTIQWDLEYVRTRTLALDIKILVVTLKQVLARRGAF